MSTDAALAGAGGHGSSGPSVRSKTDTKRQAKLCKLVLAMSTGSDRRRQAAFSRFYDEVSSLVYSHAISCLRDAQAAEEVTQDALTACWRRAASYDPARASVLTWTMMIARSRTLDRLREQMRRRSAEKAHMEQTTMADLAFEDEDVALSDDIRQMLVKLPERERRIVYMAYFAQLTHQEIALQMQMPEGTVKSVLYAALRSLRREMEVDDA